MAMVTLMTMMHGPRCKAHDARSIMHADDAAYEDAL
jgi:hypothetical protein